MADQVSTWEAFAKEELGSSDFARVGASFEKLNDHLTLRTFFVGHELSAADLAVFAALKVSKVWLKNLKMPNIDAKYPHLVRWYNHLDASEEVRGKLAHVYAAPAPAAAKATDKGEAKKKDQGSFDIDLPGAERGKVVTRFPPEPSGYMHIGHAKAALLNEYFARHYEGKLIVRFDDTNPSKEKEEFEHAILEDLERMQIKADIVSHTSDWFDELQKRCVELIQAGKAYVDDTQKEQMRAERMDGIASKCRDQSVEENLRRWDEMVRGTPFGFTCCVRAKMSVDAKNKALRDPVMFRCNATPHARTVDKYKVYPTYDFACPVVDSLEGVTHALRTSEYRDRNDQYQWFLDALSLRKVHIWDYSRVNFVYTLLSKRKLTWFVEEKRVTGWDDPRFPTIRGILRRGMTVSALKEYILMQGASKNTLLLEWDKLWAINKKVIDPIAPRFTAVNSTDYVEVRLSNGPAAPEVRELAKHKKNPEVGTKRVTFSSTILLEQNDAKEIAENEEVTLMDWGNAFMRTIHRDAAGNVTSIDAELHLEGDFKKTSKKLTWLSKDAARVPATLLDYDFLITKKKLEEEDSLEGCLNEKTVFETPAEVDASLMELKQGDIIQLERKGFFICDSAANEPRRFILIPDGRVRTPGQVTAGSKA